MSQNKEEKPEHKCEGCGSDRVVITEEKNAKLRCAECGKSKNDKK